MGSNLRRQLREALPPTIKGLQRAVALELADDARWNDDWKYDPEKGRRSKAKLADIVRWTAAKDELSVREMLRRLSVAGWEFRLPIGKGRDGRLLYAIPGMAMQFRVPDFEAPTVVGPSSEGESEDPTTVGPLESEGPTTVGEGPTTVGEGPTTVGEGPTVVGEGPTVVGPPSPSTSPCSSPEESPSSSVAEDSAEGSVVDSDGTDGGGGGSPSLEEITKQCERVDAFVGSLDYRGRQPGRQQRMKLGQRVTAAFMDGWTENGLRRYLDISDDPNIRSAAAVYLHKLSEDELPAASEDEGTALPPVCNWCKIANPAAEFNVQLRLDPLGRPCPKCHPDVLDNVLPGDKNALGWLQVSRELAGAAKAATGHRAYTNEHWHQAADPFEAAKIPHCESPNCDPVTRLKTEPDWTGEPHTSICGDCHPAMKF